MRTLTFQSPDTRHPASLPSLRPSGNLVAHWLRAALARAFVAATLFFLLVPGRAQTKDQYTPLIGTPLNPQVHSFRGTDGREHVVYELMISNSSPQPATLRRIEVLDSSKPDGKPGGVLASYDGARLASHLRKLSRAPVTSGKIDANSALLALVDIDFAPGAPVPRQLIQRITVLGFAPGLKTPGPGLLTYQVAPVSVVDHVITIGPPLAGKGWVAFNGCCAPGGAHRETGLPVNGRVFFAQRFAIDWMRLDDRSRIVHGDPSNVHDYADYGADVLAVADGVVVQTLDTLNDQTPPESPDPSTITLDNVGGNYIILDIGNGIYAFYAHLQKGSILVAPGARVKRGQVLAKLGNSGNTSAPHLHFHLMDRPSMLASSGVPYVIDTFSVAGHISGAKFGDNSVLTGSWGEGLLPKASQRHDEFPMDLTVVDFSSGAQGGKAAGN